MKGLVITYHRQRDADVVLHIFNTNNFSFACSKQHRVTAWQISTRKCVRMILHTPAIWVTMTVKTWPVKKERREASVSLPSCKSLQQQKSKKVKSTRYKRNPSSVWRRCSTGFHAVTYTSRKSTPTYLWTVWDVMPCILHISEHNKLECGRSALPHQECGHCASRHRDKMKSAHAIRCCC